MVHLRGYRENRGAAAGRPLPARDRPSPAHVTGTLKTRRANAALLLPAVLWVFTQLVMSGFILQPSVAQADGVRVITICSGTELTKITVDADGNPVKDIPAKKVTCPWCAQFAGVGPVPMPDMALVSAPCSDGQRIGVAQAHPSVISLSHTPYASRAPPFPTSL